ncbi:Clp protease N-terminal domain-containing protein [Streptomyces griseoviridis]|uniref:Clp protease N-terminal domain-containing protein n=1 Tax=Streptomyces griseoviridis TaxID=45398 RepID=UPI0034529104
MQAPLPRQPLGDRIARPPENDDAGLSAELAAVVSGARRRAVRDGDRQIDSAHLLHSLLEHDPEARAVLDDGPEIARLLGYLVQRSIGYGLRWQGSVERSHSLSRARLPASAGSPDTSGGTGGAGRADGAGAVSVPVPVSASVPVAVAAAGDSDGLSPLAALAMGHARSLVRDGGPARGLHLFAALVADPGARSVEVLERAGLDRYDVLARVEKLLAREGAAAWWERRVD